MAMDVHCRLFAVTPGGSAVLAGQTRRERGCVVYFRGSLAELCACDWVRVCTAVSLPGLGGANLYAQRQGGWHLH
jgi:hypothetical protein